MNDFSVAASAYGGAIANLDTDRDLRVDEDELRRLPPQVATSLVRQSYTNENPLLAPTQASMRGDIDGPLPTAPLDRDTLVTMLAAMPDDALSATLGNLSGWASDNPQAQKELATGLLKEIGTHRYANLLEGVMERQEPIAKATSWLRCLSRNDSNQVKQDLAANYSYAATSVPHPLLMTSLPEAMADLFTDHDKVFVGEVIDSPMPEWGEVKDAKAITGMLPMLAARGVKALAVEVPASEQALLDKLAAGEKIEHAPGERRSAVEIVQDSDPEWVEMVQAARKSGMRVVAVDVEHDPRNFNAANAVSRERELAANIGKIPGKTLVFAEWAHGGQNIPHSEAPAATRLKAAGVSTASVKMESMAAIKSVGRTWLEAMRPVAPPEVAGPRSAQMAVRQQSAFTDYARVLGGVPEKSFAYPTAGLGEKEFLYPLQYNEGLGSDVEPRRYQGTFDQVFYLSPDDSE